jgi:NAD(P)-dependent dehydrogenase (short-subunit alcohol dehydrogenase family)
MNSKKTVLITGAGGNVGQAAVNQFLQNGYRVVAMISPGKRLPLSSEDLYPVEVNLSDEEATEKAVQGCISKFRDIDAALITAGGWAGGSLNSARWNDIEKMIRLNFQTAFNVVRPVFLRMKEQSSGGRIVLFGARTALIPREGKSSFAYALSKKMLFHFAELLNAEGEADNVITSVVVPATIDTPQNREAMPDATFSDWVTPEEFAKVMAFLCSQDATAIRQSVIKLYGGS